jgi:hypothetical protein
LDTEEEGVHEQLVVVQVMAGLVEVDEWVGQLENQYREIRCGMVLCTLLVVLMAHLVHGLGQEEEVVAVKKEGLMAVVDTEVMGQCLI